MDTQIKITHPKHGTLTIEMGGVSRELGVKEVELLIDNLETWKMRYSLWQSILDYYTDYTIEKVKQYVNARPHSGNIIDSGAIFSLMMLYTEPVGYEFALNKIAEDYNEAFGEDIRKDIRTVNGDWSVVYETKDNDKRVQFLWFVYEKYIQPSMQKELSGTKK